jgi:hypothetical protein
MINQPIRLIKEVKFVRGDRVEFFIQNYQQLRNNLLLYGCIVNTYLYAYNIKNKIKSRVMIDAYYWNIGTYFISTVICKCCYFSHFAMRSRLESLSPKVSYTSS